MEKLTLTPNGILAYGFPYKKTAYVDSVEEVDKCIANLRTYQPEAIHGDNVGSNLIIYEKVPVNASSAVNYYIAYHNQPPNMRSAFEKSFPIKKIFLIITPDDIYEKVTKAGDLIGTIEHQRLQTVVGGMESIYDAFMKNVAYREKVLQVAVDKYELTVDSSIHEYYHKMREAIYMLSVMPRYPHEATQFNPVIISTIVKEFGVRSLIDGCAGWGDRLLAACAADIDYLGFDVNRSMDINYKFIIDKYGNSAKQRVIMHPIETAKLDRNRKFDAGFISPPFFNYENYQPANEEQSTNMYRSQAAWISKFLIPALLNVWSVIKPGGFFFIYYTDLNRVNTIGPALNAMRNQKNAEWYGIGGKPRQKKSGSSLTPIWIFRKVLTVGN